MMVGLIDIDSKIANLALMKISAFHKGEGDRVKFWNAFERFDKVYASKIFSHSRFHYLPKEAILGGPGFNTSALPPEIEHCCPDYGLYGCKHAMGYITRGCINRCPFCVVPDLEGAMRFHAPLEEFWQGQKEVWLLDNCITDCKPAWGELEKIRDLGLTLDLAQGFNVRTILPECARILSAIRPKKQWRIAWDSVSDEAKVMQGIQVLNSAGVKNWKIMCFVLVGYNSSLRQDLYRIQKLDGLGIDPFVMPFTGAPLERYLARWCNRKQVMHSCGFFEYLRGRVGAKAASDLCNMS